MRPKIVTSLQNDLVKSLARLRDRRHRDRRGLMLIEEPLVIERALDAGHPVQMVCFCPDLLGPHDRHLLDRLQGLPALERIQMSEQVLAKIAYRDQPPGLLVAAPVLRHQLADLQPGPAPLLIVLEGLEKPGNLGAVLRLADGAGAGGVILCDEGADPSNPNVLRASRGACFHVRTALTSTAKAIAYLRKHGIPIVATSPRAELVWHEADLTGPVALILGAEHEGLSPAWLEAADRTVAIPMLGAGDSLNVSTSAAVILYEALRQRGRELK